MKKILFLVAFAIISLFTYSQSTVLLRGDTIKVYKQGDTATLKVEGEVMITHYKAGSSTDSLLRWDPVSKKLRMTDASGITGTNIYNSNGILSANRTLTGLNNTYSLNFDSLNSWRVQRNGITRFSMSSSTSSMIGANTNAAFTANSTQAIVNYQGNALRVAVDSSTITKILSYETNIHGSFTPYTHIDKSFLDSVLAAATPNETFAESVVKSNDSVFLKNEKIEPATDPSAYGYADGTYGYKPVIKLNESNRDQDYLIKYDTASHEYQTFNPNIFMGKFEFVARRSGYISAGDSVLIDSNFINRKVWGVQIDGDWLNELPGHDYYEANRATGELTIHPSPSDSSRVTVYTSWEPIWSNLSRHSAPPPLVWNDFDFENVTDFSEVSPNIWAASGGFNCTDNYGLSNTTIANLTDGAIRAQYYTTDNGSAIGVDVANTQACYTTYDAWISVDLGVVYCGSNSTTLFSGGSLTDGDYYSIWRVGSVYTARTSTDGINWTVIYTYSASSTAQLYLKADGFSGNKIFYPQKY